MRALRRHAELEGKDFLVCVGAMRAGTSWLYAQLREAPQVAVSPLKEVHFFDARFPAQAIMDVDELALRRLAWHLDQPGDPVENLRRRPAFRASLDRARMVYDDDAYFAHFAALVRPGTRALADLTPAYAAIGAAGFAEIRRFCESQGLRPRLLFVMRDPVERLWSHLRLLPQLGRDVDPRVDWPSLLEEPAVMARADYRGVIEALEEVFAPEDRLLLFHETLTGEGVARLFRWLEIPSPAIDAQTRWNEAKLKAPLPEAAARAFRRALAGQYAYCEARFGAELPAAWRRWDALA
ncbi:sulfotransferase [Albimonas sp. CAU 1670]|uniref:sulfotransferase n=1 Tax=Albimonas sp. CAU 1670 TaxID=3032599 RepID=UPI0023D98B3F|nr:sulfotransferase [Albimonas sp. CAU 1670]MDF2231749.1 sulfotransferase [Albimonas sp. CAU 1670]